MAYFPNGTTALLFGESECEDCLNYRDNGSGSFGCAIMDAHMCWQTDRDPNNPDDKLGQVLDFLIPEDGLTIGHCRMRLTREQLGDEHATGDQHG